MLCKRIWNCRSRSIRIWSIKWKKWRKIEVTIVHFRHQKHCKNTRKTFLALFWSNSLVHEVSESPHLLTTTSLAKGSLNEGLANLNFSIPIFDIVNAGKSLFHVWASESKPYYVGWKAVDSMNDLPTLNTRAKIISRSLPPKVYL